MSDRMTNAVIRWMATDARRLRDARRLVDAVVNQLVAAGIPIVRSGWGLQLTGGNDLGRGITWLRGNIVLDREFPLEEMHNERFIKSAFREVMFGGNTVRRRLLDPDARMDYPLLAELREEGMTDYVMHPMKLLDGRVHAASWATDDDFGFTADHLEAIEATCEVAALLLELWDRRPPSA